MPATTSPFGSPRSSTTSASRSTATRSATRASAPRSPTKTMRRLRYPTRLTKTRRRHRPRASVPRRHRAAGAARPAALPRGARRRARRRHHGDALRRPPREGSRHVGARGVRAPASSASARIRTASPTSPSSGDDLIGARLHARAGARRRAPGAARRGHRRAGAQHARRAPRAGEGARVIRWDVGGYVVGFTTRVGGVSEGPYASLNLGLQDRRRPRCARARTGASPAPRSAPTSGGSRTTTRCTPTASSAPRRRNAASTRTGSGPTSRASRSSRCRPTACRSSLVATDGTPALAVLHAGWKGLLAGIVAEGVDALGGGVLAAAIGPAIGPCCYEVGEEVAAPYRERFGDDVVHGRNLDLWTSAERALRAAGVARIDALRPLHVVRAGDVLLPPPRPRRDRPPGSDRLSSPAEIRERYEQHPRRARPGRHGRRRDEVRVPRGHGGTRRSRHRGRGGEPRAGSRGEARRVRRRVPLALHRPPPEPQGAGRERDLRARATRCRRSPRRASSRSPRSSRSTSPASRRSRV